MILYNVSMNKTGLQYLLESQLEATLSHCMEDESSSEEVQLLCLRVLQSVTYGLTEPKYIHALTTTIAIERIETMACSKRSDIRDAARQVIKHLQDTKKIIKWYTIIYNTNTFSIRMDYICKNKYVIMRIINKRLNALKQFFSNNFVWWNVLLCAFFLMYWYCHNIMI